jgi:hypothetical protein
MRDDMEMFLSFRVLVVKKKSLFADLIVLRGESGSGPLIAFCLVKA